MGLAEGDRCGGCGADLRYTVGDEVYSHVIGVEYAYGDPDRYDGVSEWRCPNCGRREGRWTGDVLADGESEPRFGGPDSICPTALTRRTDARIVDRR